MSTLIEVDHLEVCSRCDAKVKRYYVLLYPLKDKDVFAFFKLCIQCKREELPDIPA